MLITPLRSDTYKVFLDQWFLKSLVARGLGGSIFCKPSRIFQFETYFFLGLYPVLQLCPAFKLTNSYMGRKHIIRSVRNQNCSKSGFLRDDAFKMRTIPSEVTEVVVLIFRSSWTRYI